MIGWLKQLWIDWRNLDRVFEEDCNTLLRSKLNQEKKMNKSSKFDNGDILVDTVTGLEGVVMVVAFYSTGCIHYGIQPRSLKESGEPKDWTWLDESRLYRKEVQAVKFQIVSGRTSGPMPQGPKL